MNVSSNLLDPGLHTPQYVAMRSPFLFTMSKNLVLSTVVLKLTAVKYVVLLPGFMNLDQIFISN